MTLHPALFPTILLAAATAAASAALRRAVRREYPSLLPWMWTWGALCTIPALLYAALSLPGFEGAADELNDSMRGTWAELLAGAAGVLPGLLWDAISERPEQGRRLPSGLPAAALRALLIAALLTVLLIPYGGIFNRTPHSAQASAPEPTEATEHPETAPSSAAEQTEATEHPETAPSPAPEQTEATEHPHSAPSSASSEAAPAEAASEPER